LYTSALPERSHDPYLHFYLGELYQRTGEVRKAEAALRTALSLAPDLEGAWLRLASLLHERGETREAVALLEEATARLDHAVPLLVRLGVLEALLPDVTRALATLDRAARIAPLSPEVWRAKGDILLAQGAYPEAIEAFSRLVSLRPDDPSAHFSLGLALFKGGDLPGARDHLERALRGTKDPRQAQIARRLIESLPPDGQETGNGIR
ncbi:MAG: tetratricopeptide repeat protein, partial [Deltaproteobacteria bacterium]